MQTFKIHSVVDSKPAQYGKTRVVFKTNETGEKMISCFTNYPESIDVGKTVTGRIVEKEKEGKTYYNFEFGRVGETPKGATNSEGMSLLKQVLTNTEEILKRLR